MAVDKSYGSGKPRSAANSSARSRVATRKLSKSKGFREQVNAKSLRTTGKPQSTEMLELGVGGFKMIAGALAKAASKAVQQGKVSGFEEAMTLSRQASLAAKFPKSSGAKKVLSELKQTMIRHQSQGGGSGVPRGVLNRTGYQIPREESIVIARGAAKVIGKSAGGDRGIIALGKEFGKIARQPKTPYFNKETRRFVNPEVGPYQVRASNTGKIDLKDNIVRGYPVGGPNADRISRISRESQSELIRRNVQRDIAKKQKDIKKRGR